MSASHNRSQGTRPFLEMAREFADLMDIIQHHKGKGARHNLLFPLIREEYEEVLDASVHNVLQGNHYTRLNLAKELADLVYVIYQYANAFKIDLDRAFELVHESNLAKLVDGKPLRDENGKVMKGPNYVPPNLEECV